MDSHTQTLILQAIAFIVALIGAVIDVRTTKIPNVLTFPAAAVGIILNTLFFGFGPHGLINAVAGWFVGVILTIAMTLGRKAGFGDSKLIGAVGAFLGWKDVILVFFYFCILWGVVAVYRFCSALPWKRMGGALLAAQSGGPMFSAEDNERIRQKMKEPIPIAPWIAGGTLLTELIGQATWSVIGFP